MEGGNSPDSLPAGWILENKVFRDGSKLKCYTNLKTGQTFYTEKDLLRYAHYATTKLPLQIAGTYTDQAIEDLLAECSKNKAANKKKSVSATETPILLEEQPLKKGVAKQGNRNSRFTSKKSKGKKEIGLAKQGNQNSRLTSKKFKGNSKNSKGKKRVQRQRKASLSSPGFKVSCSA